jgi:hypothetical protein
MCPVCVVGLPWARAPFTGFQFNHQPIAPLPRRDNTCAVAFASNLGQEQTPTLMAIATEDERSHDVDGEG